jgi:hypothetical protein
MEVSGQLHAPTALIPEKSPEVPIGWEAGWGPEAVWTLQRREKNLSLLGVVYEQASPSPFAIPTDLSRLIT